MTTTPRTASTSDARKRIEGAMNALRDGLREAVENMDTSKIEAFLAAGYEANHTPPPVPREPWRDISTDRDKPTLAKVTLKDCSPIEGSWWRSEHEGWLNFGHTDFGWEELSEVESVELLHTHDPVTHLPVERTLIDEAWGYGETSHEGLMDAGFVAASDLIRRLAALADGAQVVTAAGWVDRFGDVWHLGDDGLMHSFETAPFPREHVEKKWGPLRPIAEVSR